MSKIIITGIENGNIKYIEGEEEVVSILSVQSKIDEIKRKISVAKSVSVESLEKEHLEIVETINRDYEMKLNELSITRNSKLADEERRFNEVKKSLLSTDELLSLEEEKAKLNLILDGIRVDTTKLTPENKDSQDQANSTISVTPAANINQVENNNKSSLVQASIPRPTRIIT